MASSVNPLQEDVVYDYLNYTTEDERVDYGFKQHENPLYTQDHQTEGQSGWGASVYLNTIGIPIIVIIGVFGNMLSLSVFLFTRMRSQTCSIYLAHLNIADTGFLLCLIPAWLGWFNVDIFNRNGWCQITVYATFVFSFLSAWTVVAFTVERYIVVYHPLRKPSMCTKKRALTVLICLDIGACLLYVCTLWMTGLTKDYGLPTCTPLPKYHIAFKHLSMIDTAVTLIIPSVSVVIFNCAILTKIYLFSKQMKVSLYEKDSVKNRERETDEDDGEQQYLGPEREASRSSSNNSNPNSNPNSNANAPKNKERLKTISKRLQESSTRRRRLYRMKTTRSLVLVSSSFLVLNMPSHAFRLYLFFSSVYETTPNFSGTVVILHEVAMFIYYINFACNVFLYVLFSQSFRYGFVSLVKALRKKLRQLRCPSCYNQCRDKITSFQCVQLCLVPPVNIDMDVLRNHNSTNGDKSDKVQIKKPPLKLIESGQHCLL